MFSLNIHKPYKFKNSEGFALIELLIVIAIIGILAAIALPIFLNQQLEAAKASTKSDTHNTVANIASYLLENPAATVLPESVKVSTEGNTVTVSGGASGYTVCVANINAPDYSWGFNSQTGSYSQGCAAGTGGNSNTGGATQPTVSVFTCGDTTYTFTGGTFTYNAGVSDFGTPYPAGSFTINSLTVLSSSANQCEYLVDYSGVLPPGDKSYDNVAWGVTSFTNGDPQYLTDSEGNTVTMNGHPVSADSGYMINPTVYVAMRNSEGVKSTATYSLSLSDVGLQLLVYGKGDLETTAPMTGTLTFEVAPTYNAGTGVWEWETLGSFGTYSQTAGPLIW